MYLGVQTHPFDEPLEDTFGYLQALGIEGLDIKLDPDDYLHDDAAQAELESLLDTYDLRISVLGAAGTNPLHPDAETAAQADDTLRQTIRLAEALEVDTVTAFSGLPGATPADTFPNWLTSPVPPRGQLDAHDYQWEVATEYWADLNEFAAAHGIDVALEIHLRMLVNNPPSLVRLREAAGDRVGAYVDPGHLTLQGIDPSESIRYLAEHDALFHFEASDVKVYEGNRRLRGLWDMDSARSPMDRPWTFCAVGYGHGDEYWRDIISTLNLVGYDGPISIQHLHTPEPFHEGLENAVTFLQDMVL